MESQLRVLSVYQEFFLGGARILHSDLIRSLQADYRQRHTVLSIQSEAYRQHTLQHMANDSCYQALTAKGIPVTSLGRTSETISERTEFAPHELAAFERLAADSDVILSLKEQPLGLLNQAADVGKPILACLHRSDPENQGAALDELRVGVLSGRISLCTINSEVAKAAYCATGIPESKIKVITNGVDMTRFVPSAAVRRRVRRELGIPNQAPVVMFAARYDFMKNVPLFLQSVQRYLAHDPSLHVLMCGGGMSQDNEHLVKALHALLSDHLAQIHLLGMRRDMESLYASADIVSSTSCVGETYPLCLLEGMACGAVAVSTDVGDTRPMLEGLGTITPSDPVAIALAWREALRQRGRFRLTPADRERFSQTRMIAAYAETIARLVRRRPAMSV